jgi:molybdopterin molybdotransferase
MISVAEARDRICRHATPLPVETVPLDRAHGRILREPVAAAEDVPPFDRSAMDGYAIRADDPADEWHVVGEIRAGDATASPFGRGEALRIFTGARLPAPGLKVVMQEDVEANPPCIRLLRRSDHNHIRRQGEDARAGEILLQPGMPLDATAVALLASVGKTAVPVSSLPRILHLTTGDEIVPPGHALVPGQIRNSNGPLIAALCHEWGAGEVTHLHARDDLPAMIELLARADAKAHDLILISGGSGGGKYDFTGELLRHLGVEIHFRQVDVRPGKPLLFGTSPAQLVFGLPGNALSHFVCFHLFLRTALNGLLGRSNAVGAISAILAGPMLGTANSRETWWPARTEFHEGRVEVRAVQWKSSGDITRLPAADALIQIPAGTPQLSAGARVAYLSTRTPF